MESRKSQRDAAASGGDQEDSPGRSGNGIDFGDLDRFVGFQLHRTRNMAASQLARLIRPESVPGHFPILYLIGRNPGSTQSAIAAAVGLDRSSLVPILNRFEQMGWVRRSPAREDRRAHSLSLTSAGEEKLAQLQATVLSLEERFSGALGEPGHRSMLELLHRLQRTFDDSKDRPL